MEQAESRRASKNTGEDHPMNPDGVHSFSREYGMSTKEALVRLHEDMNQEIAQMKGEFSKRKLISWLKESLSFESELSKMRWPSVFFMTAQAIAHFVVAFALNVNNLAMGWVGFQGFILIILILINLTVNLWDTQLRFKELLMKSEGVLKLVKKCSEDQHLLRKWKLLNWSLAKERKLFIPKSPSIHQTLTYRDESCLNLPDYLLVKGDIIHLFPGERAPGDCVSLSSKSDKAENKAIERIMLQEGQIFHTRSHNSEDISNAFGWSCEDDGNMENLERKDIMMQFSHARLKRANKGTDFIMISTPYIKSLRITLQQSHKRPVNSVEKECFIVSRKYFETFVIPCVFLLSTIVTAIHYGYLDLTDDDQKIKTISIAYLLLRPSLTIMPFLPWMFPCFWLVINAYGSARILCCGEAQRSKSSRMAAEADNQGFSPDFSGHPAGANLLKVDNLLATPTAAGSSEIKHDDDDLHDLSSKIRFVEIFKVFIDLIRGSSNHVWRSSNLLQVLGCLTSLCCIDKVGILSWSNPTPEKVFILTDDEKIESECMITQTNDSNDTDSQRLDLGNTLSGLNSSNDYKTSIAALQESQVSHNQTSCLIIKPSNESQCRAEILDVSQTTNSYRGYSIDAVVSQQQCRVQFDDLNWKKYLSNLKPLGLSILMNNCCEKSFGDYYRFYKHISYESILRCNLTPVVKRRCVCGLSKLIGFSKGATNNYKYVNQIGIYRLIDPNLISKGKLVSSMEKSTRLKLPFPNMTCNIHRDVETGGQQVFSHGTADIILDACVEYWRGDQLMPLDESARKKIMDFYHRTSLTSYCSAFAYSPLSREHELSNHYIELPPEHSKFAPHLRKLANEQQEEYLNNQLLISSNQSTQVNGSQQFSQDNNLTSDAHYTATTPRLTNHLRRRHLSAEGLCEFDECKEKSIEKKVNKRSSKRTHKLNDALDELDDQVFVGMVAMQYQACPDFVALVEQLELACIRFVHFSKENELRSRVFSEKMGLESGWNCHISLQSDQDLDHALKQESKEGINDNEREDYLNQASRVDSSSSPATYLSNLLLGRTSGLDVERGSISSDEHTLYSWKSLPSLVMQLLSKVSYKVSLSDNGNRIEKQGCLGSYTDAGQDNQATSSEMGDEQETDVTNEPPKDEGFESLAFDMSNRAKLPKGIENIRPHLETVDNVPLQVSLFTDCTQELTKEMIEIMQDYGEIVCVIGSSSSRSNTAIFLQANASIAIEPLMPQSCTREDDRIQRTLDRKKRRMKRMEYHQNRKLESQKAKESDMIELTSIHANPRPNNPRDRLGIGPVEPSKPMRTKVRPTAVSSSSSSSSTSDSSSCSSSSSDSENELVDKKLVEDGDLIDDNSESSSSLVEDLPEPSALASRLACLPCSYHYNRKDQVNLYCLIMEARHFTFKMKNTFVCMICFALSISSAQFLASILFLPPMLSSGLTIWLTVVVVPLMSFSLMSTTMDSQVMKIAVGKNLQLKPENITFFVICYLIKFIPSIIVVVLSFGLIIAHSCKLTGFGSSSLGPCWMFTYVQHGNATSQDTGDEDLLWSTHLFTAQVCAAFLLVLYFVVISSGFVHRSHLMWQRSPTRNHFWVLTSLVLIIGQLLYNQMVLQINLRSSSIPYEFMASLPLHIWVISFLWPFIVVCINLLVKRAEIKATIRQQRRARFDFNTKLGMNSPF